MKKILLIMAAVLCVATASAQNKVKQGLNISEDTRCAVGLRVGTGAELVGEVFYGKDVQIEGRLGWNWDSGFSVSALHVWNPKDWAWTPDLGWWFFDAGVGAFVGAGHGHVNFGVAGEAKFGILFKNVPIRLSIDVTPHIGLVAYNGGMSFYRTGIFNGGLTATYCF